MFGLRTKITLTYALLIAIALILLLVFIDQTVSGYFIREKETSLLKQANILADTAAPRMDNLDSIRPTIDRFAKEIPGRILISNQEGYILLDSFRVDDFEGQQLKNKEILGALTGIPTTGTHYLADEGWVIYVAVPILRGDNIIGSVLISTAINDTYTSIQTITEQVLYFSLVILVLVALTSLILAAKISKPIVKLTKATERMAQGELDQQVQVKGKDEIARLSDSFNTMAIKLNQLDETRRAFVADASHELRSPLAAMKALAESLLHNDNTTKEQYREFIQDINTEIDRLTKLVNDLLLLARLDKGKEALNKELTDLDQLLEDLIRKMTPLADKRKITLTYNTDGPILTNIDPDQIYRAVWNLLDNSIKYTPKGGKTSLTLKKQPDNITISVADNGVGIKEKERIFERFSRADKARSRQTGGFGLGLSIVDRITKLHDGTITIESKENQGTTIQLEIPKNS